MANFGAYLVLSGEAEVVKTYIHRLVDEGFDPIMISPTGVGIESDAKITVLEPEREERGIRADSLLLLMRSLTRHLKKGEGKAVIIYGLQVLRQNNEFRDLTNFIGRLYEEACVNRGLVLLFSDPRELSSQELAFLEREATVLENLEQLFDASSETIK
jgi:hypothetical protein